MEEYKCDCVCGSFPSEEFWGPRAYPPDLSIHKVSFMEGFDVVYVINIERANYKTILKGILFDKATEFCLENRLDITCLKFVLLPELLSCIFKTQPAFNDYDDHLKLCGWHVTHASSEPPT